MATATFTAANQQSIAILVDPQGSVTYSLDDGAGTFAGTVLFEKSEYATFGYTTVATYTANQSSTTYVNETVKPFYFRLNCTAFTGDATTWVIGLAEGEVSGLSFQGGELIDSEGRNVFTVTQGGVSVSGTLSADTIALTTTTTEDMTITDDLTVGDDAGITGDATVGGTLGVTGVATFTAAPVFSSATASQAVFTNGSKALVSNAITGTGNVVMSASPTLTGTIGAADQTLSGTLGVTGVATFTAAPVFSSTTVSTALFVDGAKALVSNAITGTGNVVMSASPTLTGTISAADLTLSGTLGVTGVATFTAAPVFSSATASQAMFTDGSKALTSNAITGTGNVVMSASPTLTGTIGAANQTLSGTLGVTGVATFTAAPVFSSSTASQAVFTDGSKALVSNAITGTGNVVMSASPTLTGTIGAASQTLSGTLGVTGVTTLSGYVVHGFTNSITAFAGGGQASATALTTTMNRVSTCATHSDSVKLPASPTAGTVIMVRNDGAKDLAVFPASGAAINSLGTDASRPLAPSSMQRYLAASSTQWYTMDHGVRMVDRGDASANDFDQTTLTLDGTYRDLDLSAIVGPAAYGRLVWLKVRYGNATAVEINIRTNGNSNTANIGGSRAVAAGGNTLQDVFVFLDSAGIIEYNGGAATAAVITVRGWQVEG